VFLECNVWSSDATRLSRLFEDRIHSVSARSEIPANLPSSLITLELLRTALDYTALEIRPTRLRNITGTSCASPAIEISA
jgi:hypothetical protein